MPGSCLQARDPFGGTGGHWFGLKRPDGSGVGAVGDTRGGPGDGAGAGEGKGKRGKKCKSVWDQSRDWSNWAGKATATQQQPAGPAERAQPAAESQQIPAQMRPPPPPPGNGASPGVNVQPAAVPVGGMRSGSPCAGCLSVCPVRLSVGAQGAAGVGGVGGVCSLLGG